MNEHNPIVWPGWQTLRVLGRGSYGAVYEVARDSFGVQEKAAVKCISLPQNPGDIEDLFGDGYDAPSVAATYEAQLKQILQEYQLMAELRGNAHVVRSDDISCEHQDNGLGWNVKIKMELLTPMNRAKVTGTVEQQALRLGQDLCLALIECKNKNIVHRDIKPQNIFLADNGDYKLGDFGIARTMEKTTGATKTGTYNYMAPEVYNNAPYGHQADVYSLGMVLYWLLNERRGPFLPLPPQIPTAAQQEQARLRRFGGEPLPPPKNGSEGLKAIVLKACAYDPKDRYVHAGELYNELEALRDGKREPAPGPVGADASPPGTTRRQEPPWSPGGPQEKERIATPVTRSLARNDKTPAKTKEKDPSTSLRSAQDDKVAKQNPSGPAGHLPLQGRQEKANAKSASGTVGADASGGPMGGRSVKQNPSGPAGHLPLQGRQEKADAPRPASTVGADALGGPKDSASAKQNPSGPAGHLHPPLCPPRGHLSPPGRVFPLQGRQEKTNAQDDKAAPAASPPVILSEAKNLPETKGKDPSTPPQSGSAQDDKVGTPVGAIHESPAPKKKKKSPTGLILGLGAAAVLLIAALVLLPRLRGDAALIPASAEEAPVEVTFSPDAEFYEADGLTYVLDGNALTVTGEGRLTAPGEVIPEWETRRETLERVVLGEGITAIRPSSFSVCPALREVRLPESLQVIDNHAFYACKALTAIELPAAVRTIGANAFQHSGLETVALPEGLETVYGYSFFGCSSLRSIYLPASVTEISTYAFRESGLQEVRYGGSAEEWNAIAIYGYNDPLLEAAIRYDSPRPGEGAETGEAEAGELTCTLEGTKLTVSGAGALTKERLAAAIPDWTTQKETVETVEIKPGVTAIGDYAFSSCKSLTSVSIPQGVREIGEGAFKSCESLPSISLPAGVMTIGASAFHFCKKLTSVTLSQGLTTIGDNAFKGCRALTSVTLPEGVTEIGAGAFQTCNSLESITLPKGLTKIGESAFSRCERLTSVTIPEGVTEIGHSAFNACLRLSDVSLPSSLTEISRSLFDDCSGLTSITVPEGVTGIDQVAFANCYNLKSIYIPASATRIANAVFYKCLNLSDIYFGGTREQWEAAADDNYLGYPDRFVTIHYNSN